MGHQGVTVFCTERAGQSSLRDRIYFYLGVQGSFRPSGTEGPKMSSDLKMKGWGTGGRLSVRWRAISREIRDENR